MDVAVTLFKFVGMGWVGLAGLELIVLGVAWHRSEKRS